MHFDKSILQFPSAVLQKSPGRQSLLAFFVVAFAVVVDVFTVVGGVGVGVVVVVFDSRTRVTRPSLSLMGSVEEAEK